MKAAVEGANRWTGKRMNKKWVVDNIWNMKSYLVRKQGMGSKEVDQMLEIPEDFDYIEMPAFMKS